MKTHQAHNLSYGLERELSKSIERMQDNVTKGRALRHEIIKLRRQRKQIAELPEDVKQWFAETSPYLEDEENDEGEQ